MRDTKQMVLISNLIALSVVLGIIDVTISYMVMPGVAGVRIGLANTVILLGIIYFKFSDVFLMAVLKSLLGSFILGSFTTFIIGFTGTMLSFFGMWIFYKSAGKLFSLVGVSVFGGFLHVVGQLIAVYFYHNIGLATFVYAPAFMLASIITGVMIGKVTKNIIKYIENAKVFVI